MDFNIKSVSELRDFSECFYISNTDMETCSQSDGRLTIGVEWEFLFAYVPGDQLKFDAEASGDPCCRPQAIMPDDEHIMFEQFLTQRVAQSLQPQFQSFPINKVRRTDDMTNDEFKRSYVDTWMVKQDHSVSAPHSGRYEFCGLELTSPILREDDPSLSTMLVEATRAITRNDRVKRNHKCALHVHIGVTGEQGWDLWTLKKLVALLWLAEDRLALLCHPNRARNVFSRSLTRACRVARDPVFPGDLEGEGIEDFDTWLAPLFGEVSARPGIPETEKSLARLWCAESRFAMAVMLREADSGSLRYNFKNIAQEVVDDNGNTYIDERNGPMDKKTVEFRMMDMTFNGKVVHAYVCCCVRLVRFASDSGMKEYQNIMRNLLGAKDEYSVWQFLVDIGLGQEHIDELQLWVANKHCDPLDEPLAGAEAGIVKAQR